MVDLRLEILAEAENIHCRLSGPLEGAEDQDFDKSLDIFRDTKNLDFRETA